MLKRAIILVALSAILGSCGGKQTLPQSPSGMAQLCGDPALVGEVLPTISDKNGCGIEQPVRVHFVSGVALNERPVLNCNTARTLRTWVDNAAQPSVEGLNAHITNLRVVSHYACRTRNSQSGARLSEHATGSAIDIAGFTLSTGDTVTVLEHWRHAKYGPVLRDMYKGACGPFGTTLSPDADRFHQDHMHFDTAAYRSGAYCR